MLFVHPVSLTIRAQKKADLYEVTLENIRRGIRESKDFGADIKALSESFNPTAMNYTFFAKDDLCNFLEKKAFTNTTNVHIDNESLNFVCFLLSHIMATITRTACILSECGGKSTVRMKNFKYACEIHFSGELFHLITQRLNEIESLLADVKENAKEENDNASTDSKGKKNTKTTKKTTKDNVENDDENDDDDDVNDDDNDDENDNDDDDADDEENGNDEDDENENHNKKSTGTKSGKGKKNTKTNSKKTTKDVDDDNDGNNDDDDVDADDNDDDDDDGDDDAE